MNKKNRHYNGRPALAPQSCPRMFWDFYWGAMPVHSGLDVFSRAWHLKDLEACRATLWLQRDGFYPGAPDGSEYIKNRIAWHRWALAELQP